VELVQGRPGREAERHIGGELAFHSSGLEKHWRF
jgi:hypothetical protein